MILFKACLNENYSINSEIWNTQIFPGSRDGADPEFDKENFNKLVKEMHDMLKPLGKIFTAVLTPDFKKLNIGYDVPYISQYLDYMIIRNYYLQYPVLEQNFTGHNAPLYR